MSVRDDVMGLVADDVPDLGAGETAERWKRLHKWARRGSVSVARLAEAHLDAQSILAEAGSSSDTPSDLLYGVWASSGPSRGPLFDLKAGAVNGAKLFASGIGIVDFALMTATDTHGSTWLVEVDLRQKTTWSRSGDSWSTPALADTATGGVSFDNHPASRVIGGAGWYLDRPGFWHGAIGPAACWSGAAAGLLDLVDSEDTADPYRLSARGAMRADVFSALSVLERAGNLADRAFDDHEAAHYCAIATRSVIERGCAHLLEQFSRAWGPRPFVSDPSVTQRALDIHLYLRQHHGEADLAALGALASDSGRDR